MILHVITGRCGNIVLTPYTYGIRIIPQKIRMNPGYTLQGVMKAIALAAVEL